MAAHVISDPTTTNDDVARMTPGSVVNYKGKKYRYVKCLEALAAGVPCEFGNTSGGVYKAAHASSTGRKCAGVALLTTTVNYYTFLQISGQTDILVTGGSVAKGDYIKCGTAVGVTDSSTTALSFAYALADDDSTPVVSAIIFGLD